MQKQMKIMLIVMLILFGGIFAWKFLVKILIARGMAQQSKAIAVAVMEAEYSDWQEKIPAPGTIRAIKGVNVTTQLAGMVERIYFSPGAFIKENDLMVQLTADEERALLESRKADADLARLTLERDKKQLAIQAISKQIVDNDEAKLRNAQALVAQQQAVVDKKSIRAPFSGYAGLNYVNPGQYINPGDKITTLQSLDPLYCDFFLPQQLLTTLKTGQTVLLHTGNLSRTFEGKISSIEPLVDVNTRNVAVEATLDNKERILKPGMFVNVEVLPGKPQAFITVPQTAISFNSYGDIIYVVHSDKDKNGKEVLSVMQRFVTTGDTRGEQIQVLKGLKKGETFVASGQLKLHNKSQITINNSIMPPNNPKPDLKNNH